MTARADCSLHTKAHEQMAQTPERVRLHAGGTAATSPRPQETTRTERAAELVLDALRANQLIAQNPGLPTAPRHVAEAAARELAVPVMPRWGDRAERRAGVVRA